MSIIYTDEKGKPIRTTSFLSTRSKVDGILISPHQSHHLQQQQQQYSIQQLQPNNNHINNTSPNRINSNNNNSNIITTTTQANSHDIYSNNNIINSESANLLIPTYRPQITTNKNTNLQPILQQQRHQNSITPQHTQHQQQSQQQQKQHLAPMTNNFQDLDRMSLGSINLTEDLNSKIRRTSVNEPSGNMNTSQRRTSFLRKHWQQHSDVPFVIGAETTIAHTENPCEKILTTISWILLIAFFPWSLFFTLKVVQEYERAVIFRLGRLVAGGAKGPGMFLVLPCIETYTKVDMRTVSFDVPPQEVLTKDSVTVAVDAVVYYRVFNPVISIANVENAQESTRLLAQTSLRNVLGTNSLSEILSNREAVSICMREILDEATDHWGIKVERVEIKDVRLPIQLQRAMAAEAEATREARAKVIAAEGEHKASRALKDAADVLSESSSAIQLRYLQTLNNIAGEKNSTIVFPLPIEIFSGFLRHAPKKLNNYGNNEHIAPKIQEVSKVEIQVPAMKSQQKAHSLSATETTDL